MVWQRARLLCVGSVFLGCVHWGCGGGSGGNSAPVPPIPVGSTAGLEPSITSVSPSSGPSAGGTPIVIQDSNFESGATVTLDRTQASVVSISPTTISATTPPHSPGTVLARVENPSGYSYVLGVAFEYESEPGQVLLFRDVTIEAGIDFIHQRDSHAIPVGAGASVGDFNGDEWPDLFLTNNAGPNALYINQQNGTFRNDTVLGGVAFPGSNDIGACAADYDNDGNLDLYVASFGVNHLLRNRGAAVFNEVTVAAGVGDDKRGTSCAWGDFNGDGLLDLYVTNYFLVTQDDRVPGVLYRNNGDGTFTDITLATIDLETIRVAGFGVSWLDYDNDGDLDLYLVNDFGHLTQPNVLLRNDGPHPEKPWTFSDVSEISGADLEQFGMGLATGDYDNDGWLDVYATDIGRNELLHNRGDGTFEDSTDAAGVGRPSHPATDWHNVGWGALFFDFDNDADLDLYAVAGHLDSEGIGDGQDYQPNALFRNEGGLVFADVSAGSGADDPRAGRGGVYFDYDRDGDLDLFIANINQRPTLLRNENPPGNRWILLRLVGGAGSNHDGIGARVTVQTEGRVQVRELGSGSSVHSNHSLALHFGLGTSTAVERIEVRWPSGQVQVLLDVTPNQELLIVEP